MTDDADWLDELEENSRISEARSWSIRYADILRLIAEVRRLRAEIKQQGESNYGLRMDNIRLMEETQRLRWFEKAFHDEKYPWATMASGGSCRYCRARGYWWWKPEDNEPHKPDCEYVAHMKPK